ncbi:MAG TPA: transglycosylase SLT domain-containing protein [Gemmatimonadales bacterium]|jgi:hypothetical protein|nr:transglycosylase SLT domain-containing protein [Gemmatimonadales bacterium]
MPLNPNDLSDRSQRPRRLLLRGGLLVLGTLAISVLAGWSRRAHPDDVVPTPAGLADVVRTVNLRLETTEGELAVAKIQLDRLNQIVTYSSRYQIPADLAGAVFDIALSEGIDPALGFRLVKVESSFDDHAKSSAGALGYTQILPATARFFEPGLSESQLYDRDVNLRLGFRFLKTLIRQYQGEVELALVAYNRGPARVAEILSQGGDPHNGYAQAVLKGTDRGKGTSQ